MYTPKEHYKALHRDSDLTYRQTQDIDETPEALSYSKNGHSLSCRSHCVCAAAVITLSTIVLIQSFWLFYLHWQLHPVELYSSSGS